MTMDINRDGNKFDVTIQNGQYYTVYHPNDIRRVLSLAGFINNMHSINSNLREELMKNFDTQTFKVK